MAHPLTPADKALIAQLRANNTLAHVNQAPLNHKDGIIAVFCGDGDQSHDLMSYLFTWQKQFRPIPRIHCLAINGGALRLAPGHPADPDEPVAKLLVNEIKASQALKHINAVALIGHAPCGLAGVCKLSLADTLKHYAAARNALAHALPGSTVATLLHVDYGDGKKRLYFINESDRNHLKK